MKSNWKKRTKRTVAAVLVGVMALSLAGCGGGKKGTVNVMDKEHVFREEELNFNINTQNINASFVAGDRIFFVTSEYTWIEGEPTDNEVYPEEGTVTDDGMTEEVIGGVDGPSDVIVMPREADSSAAIAESVNDTAAHELVDDGFAVDEPIAAEPVDEEAADEEPADDNLVDGDMEVDPDDDKYLDSNLSSSITRFYVTSYKLDGTDEKKIEIPYLADGGGWYNSYSADADGNVYAILNQYSEGTDEAGNYFYEDLYYVLSFDSEGNERWRLDLSELGESLDYFYASSMQFLPTGELALLSNAGMSLVNTADGSILSTEEKLNEYDSMVINQKGDIILSKYGDSGQEYYKYDMTSKTLSDKYILPGNSWNYSMYPGKVYDMYLTDSMAIYGCNFGDTELTEIMDFVDSDMLVSGFNTFVPVSDTEFIVGYNEPVNWTMKYSRLVKVDPDDVQEKTVLTLACYYLENEVKQHIIDYNKTNPNYRISVTEYSVYDSYEGDVYTSGTTQLNNDIISGKMPDILIMNSQLPASSYANKGLLADLNTYFEKDEELNRSDYMENIFDAFETDGKLYQIPAYFSVQTIVGKVSDVGTGTGWTLDELMAVYNQKPEGTSIFSEMNRESALYYAMNMCSEQFINWDTGECSFDSEGFIDLLDFLKLFPEEINYDEIYGEDYDWNEYQQQFRTGKTMLSVTYLSELSRYSNLRQGDFGEDINFIGFPTADKNGSSITSDLNFAISAKSGNKEGAWDFIRYFFTPEYQDSRQYYFPVLLSSYDALIEKAQSRPYWEDEYGHREEYDETYYLNDVEIIIEPSTDEDIEYMMNFLKSLNQVTHYNEDLNNIVMEEAASFFAGQKSAQEVATIIQSRAQIYVSENM